MSVRVPFVKGFGIMLASAGFKKTKGRIWVRDAGEVLQAIRLDNPPYVDGFSVEFGVVLKEIWPEGEMVTPPRSHLYHGLDLSGLEEDEDLLKHPRDVSSNEIQAFGERLVPRIDMFFEAFDTMEKLREYALRPDNIVPIPRRELRDWAGFDYSVWDKK